MKKLLLVLCLVLATVMLLPSVASASTPTLKQLAQTVASLQKQVTSLKSQLTKARSVLALAPYVSLNRSAVNGVAGPNIVFKGCNLQVKSKTSESTIDGTGNLIIGWDDNPSSALSGYRSGSNNLVCGDNQTFTSFGCFLAGGNNTATASMAAVSGGFNNTASNSEATVSGGANNVASGYLSVVSGGNGITASTINGWGHP
jgi:hypothetical protein